MKAKIEVPMKIGPVFQPAACVMVLLCVCLKSPTAHAQGSLTPPGPPAPTMKSLDQIEPRRPISSLPFTIASPGSYYLTTNLTGVTGTSGITIATNDVTLDLKGFCSLGCQAPSTASSFRATAPICGLATGRCEDGASTA
jgi:hypothetical protein